jgi:hypothetical protein
MQLAAAPRDFVRAASAGDARALEDSIAAGADVNAADSYGETALIAAAAGGHARAVWLLLRSGADVDARRGDGFNALIIAAFFGHKEVVRALVDYGADVTGRDRNGMNAHAWARSKGHLEVASLLGDAEQAAALRESQVASPAPAAASSKRLAAFDKQSAPPETPTRIFKAGTATGSTAADAVASNAEPDRDATLIAPAKPQAVGSAQTPRGVTWSEQAIAAVVPVVRAAQSTRRVAGGYVDGRTARSYSLSRLILLALISGLTAGATFFTINWMMPPARTEAPPATPAVIEAPQPLPQDSPQPETPKQRAGKSAVAERPAASSAAERVAAPDHAGADKHAGGKHETTRTGQPVLISAHGESTASQRPASEHVALAAAPRQVPRPTQPAGGAGGDSAVTVTPRPRATPQRTEPLTRARPDGPLTPPTQPASAPPKKVIRWP